MKLISILFLLLSAIGQGFAQNILNTKIQATSANQPLTELFQQVERENAIKFYYLDSWVAPIKIEKAYYNTTLGDVLDGVFEKTEVRYVVLYDYALILIKDSDKSLNRELILQAAKDSGKKISTVALGDPALTGKADVTIKGTLRDMKTNEAIPGVQIMVSDLEKASVTNEKGEYKLVIPPGEHIFIVQSLHYEEKVFNATVYSESDFDITLEESSKLLDEVVISSKQYTSSVNSRAGVANLQIAELRKLPTFLGEIDIVKQIQTLPGVTSVGETSSGFNVRGGGADQNLVMYDDNQVFNPSHIFGFFSMFNAEALKDAQFYKASIPASYGGRISSVLNMTSRDGSFEKFKASGGIGLISSNAMIEGPLVKNKTSIIASVRSSYSDWLLRTFARDFSDLQNSSASFYDLSLKVTQKLGETGKLQFSNYISHDHFELPTDTAYNWTNILSSVRYDKAFSTNKLLNVIASVGQYSYQVEDDDPVTAYNLKYKILYPSLQSDYTLTARNHKITTGLKSTYYFVSPPSLSPASSTSSAVNFTRNKERYWENAIYVSDDITLTNSLNLEVGVRLSTIAALGPGDVYTYQPGAPLSDNAIIDTVQYGSGEIIKQYWGVEPRASFRYVLTPSFSIKGGFDRVYQYIHLISNSVAVTPIDVWQPSNYYFRPQIGDQLSLGAFKNFKNNTYEVSVEVYRKWIQNVLDFKDGSDLVLDNNMETSLLSGKSDGYGIEFALNKVKGRFSWNFNYTYSRSFRQVAGINDGKIYPSNFDQPNIVNLNWKYGLSRRVSFTGNFTYRTGRPISIPYSYAVVDNFPIVNYSERNSYRIPDYHRLDLALIIEGNHKKKKFLDGTWAFSVYNVYARKNVYTVFYQKNPNGLQQAYQMSIIGGALPSISYRFKI